MLLVSMPSKIDHNFYLGRRFDPKELRLPSEKMKLGSDFHLSAYDLLTHGIILGMTGSGKTILGKIAIEEAALQGIPSILIDSKGDLASMSLVFPTLSSEDFIPWIDVRKGRDKEKIAQGLSELFKKKLLGFNIPPERLETFKEQVKVVVLTPRSNTGIPLAISSLPSPPPNVKTLIDIEPETVLDLIDTVVRTLIMRIFPGDLRERHRTEEKFLNSIIRYAWENEIPLTGMEGLATLVELVQTPPMKKIGVMTVDSYIPPKERHDLAININNLLVGVEQLWHLGIPLDIELILRLYSRDGKTPIIIFNLSEIPSFDDKIFIVSRIAYAIYEWMRRKGGCEEPRLMFYIDEIGGGGGKTAFFPIHPYNPPSKPPLMLLIKQARAFGVCCLFSTQNPGDIDYKGLSNCGTWIIGKLSTTRDRSKVLQGLGDIEFLDTAVNRRTLEKQIASLETGEFICKTKQGDLEFFKERWLMSYHKTMTAREIRETTEDMDRKIAATPTLVLETKRAFLPFNHRASLDDIRRHFRENVNLHVEKAECTYLPLLSFKIQTGFTKRHSFLSKEIKSDFTYGPFLIPLFKNAVDMYYAAHVLGLDRLPTNELLEEIEDTTLNVISKKLNIKEVFEEIPKLLESKINQDIVTNLNNQIEHEKARVIETEKAGFPPQFDELSFEHEKTSDRIADLTSQMLNVKEELNDLEHERTQRRRLGEPTVKITQGITSRNRKIQKIERQISSFERKISTLISQNDRLLESQNRKITLIEEQFSSIKNEIIDEIQPQLSFEHAIETYVPTCKANLWIQGHDTKKLVELAWNGYTGERITEISCSKCETFLERDSPLNICFLCLDFLCEEHTHICTECGRRICSEHSWLCDCEKVHCPSEKQRPCNKCGSLLCTDCKHNCEKCGKSLCANHIFSCAVCDKNICHEHSWICTTCNKTLCSNEPSSTCTGCHKPLCPEHRVKCPNCGRSICPSCLRLETKFFGLSKTQKCVNCI